MMVVMLRITATLKTLRVLNIYWIRACDKFECIILLTLQKGSTIIVPTLQKRKLRLEMKTASSTAHPARGGREAGLG